MDKYTIGIDFGTDSVRAIVVDVKIGHVISECVASYPRWAKGLYRHPDKNIFRQHPLDYLEAMTQCVHGALAALSADSRRQIVGIGVDTTGSTPVAVDQNGVPLALLEEFSECEDAMFYLWKDHSAQEEADAINAAFSSAAVDYRKYQGTYSAEWYWAKILHAVKSRPILRARAYTWVEHCDWIVGVLCGNTAPNTLYRSACAAGHKALWHSSWHGLPDRETLESIDPYLAVIRDRYTVSPKPATVRAGLLNIEWADKWGLPHDVVISGCSFDAHAGAVGAGIREGVIVCTVGTSAVELAVASSERLAGTSLGAYGGQAEDSILPGLIGIEAGQAAFGDIFAWFRDLLLWPLDRLRAEDKNTYDAIADDLLAQLGAAASTLRGSAFPIALDWFNGRRYPNTDDQQRAAIAELSLAVDAPALYRALVFGAVSGMKRILDGFVQSGIPVERVLAVGGISKKSPYIMQMMADLLEISVTTVCVDQTCALGAAMYAAVASNCYPSLPVASAAMAADQAETFVPDPSKKPFYHKKYMKYLHLASAVDTLHTSDAP